MYYVISNGQKAGPFSDAKLKEDLQSGELAKADLCWCEGMTAWQPIHETIDLANVQLPPEPPVTPSPVTPPPVVPPPIDPVEPDGVFRRIFLNNIDRVSGLPPVTHLPWQRVTEEVFSNHSEAEVEAIFQPDSSGGVPWFFSRVLAYGLIASILLLWGLYEYGAVAINLVPGYFFIACTTIPIATVVFIIELCGARHVSPLRAMRLLIMGGVLSLIFTFILHAVTVFEVFGFLGASIAGLIEEPAKLFAALFLSKAWADATRVRDGIVIGAIVGAGFAVFETAGYTYQALLIFWDLSYQGYHDDSIIGGTILQRGLLSPFCHVIWTAVATGALWRIGKNWSERINNFNNPKFYKIFILVMALHMAWNASFGVPFLAGGLGILAKFSLIGVTGWYLMLQLFLSDREDSEISVDEPITKSAAEPTTVIIDKAVVSDDGDMDIEKD